DPAPVLACAQPSFAIWTHRLVRRDNGQPDLLRFRFGSAISMPNNSDKFSLLRSFAVPGFVMRRLALVTRSCCSTSRSLNRSSGCTSSRAPTPYKTAATCLHMRAESGHEQLSFISAGVGNNPVFCRHNRSIVVFENRPSSNSTNQSLAPAQSRQTSVHRRFGIGETLISTL